MTARRKRATTRKAGKTAAGDLAPRPSTAMSGAAHVAGDVSDRTMSNWTPLPGSADGDLLGELGTIVPRARDLSRNNGIAAGAQQTLKDNIVGHQLRLSAKPHYRLLGQEIEWAEQWSRNTEGQFETWANTTECDAARSMNLLGLTLQGLGAMMLNGEALAIPQWIERPGEQWGTKLQLIEADRLSAPYGRELQPNMRGGVEIDRYGAPVRHWIRKTHPGDRFAYGFAGAYATVEEWTPVATFMPNGLRRVIHLYDRERTGQSRGKPIVTSVMREFRMVGHYQTTELQATIANSLIAAFLESNLDQESQAALFSENPAGAWDNQVGAFRAKLQGGAMIPLPVGAKVSAFTPSRPNTAFAAFMEAALRHIAAGLNLPYELLLKDFSKTNYSSARAALLEAWRFFLGRRRMIRDYWLTPIYQLFLDEGAARGRIDVAPEAYHANRYAYSRCRWVFAGRGWVDPVKEASAAKIRMQENLSTLESECAEQGEDWEEVLEQRAREKRRMRALDLTETPPASVSVTETSREEDRPGGDGQEGENREEAGNA